VPLFTKSIWQVLKGKKTMTVLLNDMQYSTVCMLDTHRRSSMALRRMLAAVLV
jgi:hypothetical protein